jgi:hypothetical protein
MKKRLTLAVIVLALTVCVVLCVRPGDATGITFGAYRRIEVGMPRQQVEEILGGPARREWRPDTIIGWWADSMPNEWMGKDITIYLDFDESGKVSEKRFHYRIEEEPSLWEQACSWLPW